MTRERKTVEEKMHAGEESNFTWFPTYTEAYYLLPSNEERLNFIDVVLALGSYGETCEDLLETHGGKLAMTLRANIASSRDGSIAGRKGGKISGESRRARASHSVEPSSEHPFGTPLRNTPPEPSGVECSEVEVSSSEEEEYLGVSDTPFSSQKTKKGEAWHEDAPFGRCADCELPLVELPPDYKGEVSYTCPKCGRVYDEPTTGASPNEEIPF